VNDSRRNRLIQKLEELKDQFAHLHDLAFKEVKLRLQARGFSPDEIQRETDAYLMAVKAGSIDPDEEPYWPA
jgi:hypothetical protein